MAWRPQAFYHRSGGGPEHDGWRAGRETDRAVDGVWLGDGAAVGVMGAVWGAVDRRWAARRGSVSGRRMGTPLRETCSKQALAGIIFGLGVALGAAQFIAGLF